MSHTSSKMQLNIKDSKLNWTKDMAICALPIVDLPRPLKSNRFVGRSFLIINVEATATATTTCNDEKIGNKKCYTIQILGKNVLGWVSWLHVFVLYLKVQTLQNVENK